MSTPVNQELPPQKHAINTPGLKPALSFFISVSPNSPPQAPRIDPEKLVFTSPAQLLLYITTNWENNFVTVDLTTKELVESFMKRPFFLLVSIDAPLMQRFERRNHSPSTSLEQFVRENDHIVFGPATRQFQNTDDYNIPTIALRSMRNLVNVHVNNSFDSLSALHSHLDDVNLMDVERLRPGWDTYFMTLASLASHRSNCMKRRVGAVLVRERRIVSTGYNGTPRWLKNCNEGGCGPCNGLDTKRECICLHAEENAISEAGRERVGQGAVLYCNTCPCERCTIKIIQSGVKEVVYNLEYKVDKHAEALFKEAGVLLRRLPSVSDI